MATKALLVWCAASAAACATAALATTSLWRAPVPTLVPAPPAPMPALDLPVPEAPPPELAGLEPPAPVAPAPNPAVPAFVALSGIDVLSPASDPALLRPTQPGVVVQPAESIVEQTAPDRVPGFAEVVSSELAARDPRLAVRPPPRPGFLIARLDVPARAGIVEVPSAPPPDAGSAPWSLGDIFSAPGAGRSARAWRPLGAGMASWYGPGFHGRKTASGETFNQNDLTAAHRTLPFGTRVRVVDEKTGRSIVVRINDRGPFAHGRIIDLSKASAQALGMGGTSRVKIVSAD